MNRFGSPTRLLQLNNLQQKKLRLPSLKLLLKKLRPKKSRLKKPKLNLSLKQRNLPKKPRLSPNYY